MFLGEYEHALDDRGRIAVPARFRDDFRAGLYLSRGQDRCIAAYTTEGWSRFISQLDSLPFTDDEARRTQRRHYSGAQQVDLDRQGRVLIPQFLRRYAGINQSVVIAGMNDHIEIWDSSLWAAELAAMEA